MEQPNLAPLLHLGLTFMLSMARLAAFFTASVIFGSQVLSGQVRNCLIIALTCLTLPITGSQAPGDLAFGLPALGLLVKEILIGYLLAYAFNVVFWIPEGVGLLMDNQRGAAQANEADPLSGQATSPLGSLLFQCAVMLFLGSGAMLLLLAFFMESFVTWPLFSFFPDLGPRGVEALLRQFALLMTGVVTLAGPALIACFLTDFGLGLVNRFAPQLNVFFLSMPIKSAFVIFVLIVYAAVLLSALSSRITSLDFLWNNLLQAL